MEKSEEYQIMHQYYLELKSLIEPNYLAAAKVAFEAEDPDERKFYVIVTELFLQKLQREGLAKHGIVI